MKLPDVNVLLYAINADAPQHAVACQWLEAAYATTGGVAFTWPVLLGFMRISTRQGIFARPLRINQALELSDAWLAHPAARMVQPGPRHAGVLARLLLGAGMGGPLVSDAHLAALAIEHEAHLGSFDRDFERFAGLRFEYLSA